MSKVREIVGHELMIVDVSEGELKRYERWLENETRWSGNMGYTCWPSDAEDRTMLVISSGFGGTWFREIVPALRRFWGEDRIINEIEFAEGEPAGLIGKEGKNAKYKVLPAPHLFERWRSLGKIISERGGNLLQNPGTVKEAELEEWNKEIENTFKQVQELYNETFLHITRPRD